MARGGQNEVRWNLVHVRKFELEDPNEIHDYDSIVICQNKIIVVDIKDDIVKIHRLHDGKFLDMLDSDSIPRDICLMDATTICVLHLDGLIEMASIKSEDMSPVFTRMKSFRLDGVFDYYRSVVRVNDNIVVVGEKQGMTFWCIVSLDDGYVDTIHRICKRSRWSYVTTKDNIIYISCDAGRDDDDTGVYSFDILNPSQCKYKYKHERLRFPTSIVLNEDGNIFVGNFGLYSSIHQLTASCQLVAIFSQRIPRDPQAMFSDNGLLYVTCWMSRDITVFRHVYQGSQENHGVQGEVEVSQKGNFKAVIDETETVFIHKKLAELAKSVGIIKTSCGSGTGFRVGPNYIMTARHVVEKIMRKVPFLQQQQPQLLEQYQQIDTNLFIDFGYEWNSQPCDPNHLFHFEPEIVYESAYLDTVILKLKDDIKVYPPPLTEFADVIWRLFQDKRHGYFIGHSEAAIKKTDKYQPVMLTKLDIYNAKKWSMDCVNEDGYDCIEDQNRVLFHCTFEKGASGSPGFWINPSNGQAYVELMLLCGYPKWYYEKCQGIEIPKDFFVEQGVSMKSVFDDVKAKDVLLCKTVFGTI